MYQRWKKVDHPIKKLNAVADPIPATQDKIIPHGAKPKVCRRKPKAIKLAKKMIKGKGRVLIRKSGTEAKIRIMAESENINLVKKCIHIVKKEIK